MFLLVANPASEVRAERVLENGLLADTLFWKGLPVSYVIENREMKLVLEEELEKAGRHPEMISGLLRLNLIFFVSTPRAVLNAGFNPEVFFFLTQKQLQEAEAASGKLEQCDATLTRADAEDYVLFIVFSGPASGEGLEDMRRCLSAALRNLAGFPF